MPWSRSPGRRALRGRRRRTSAWFSATASPARPASMRPWAEHLAAAGYTVRLPLLPGHGTTWQDTNRTRWTDWYGGDRAGLRRGRRPLHDRVRRRPVDGRHPRHPPGRAEGRRDRRPGAGQPVLCDRALRREVRPVTSPGPCGRRPAIGGDIKKPGVVEPAYDRTPVVAFASLQQLWRVTLADLGRITAPILHVPQPRGPRRRTAVRAAAASGATVDHGARGDPRGQLPRRDARQRRAAIFDGSVEFIQCSTSPAAAARRRQRRCRGAVTRSRARPTDGPDGVRRLDNGLVASSYVPLTDVGDRGRPPSAHRAGTGPHRRLPRPGAGSATRRAGACSSPRTSAPTRAPSSPPPCAAWTAAARAACSRAARPCAPRRPARRASTPTRRSPN